MRNSYHVCATTHFEESSILNKWESGHESNKYTVNSWTFTTIISYYTCNFLVLVFNNFINMFEENSSKKRKNYYIFKQEY